ncbi:unnamed protein product [Polarella glacialis]|uniref:CSC1/OSCA1-like 7TM region domain-containing protein n=1 Tax=Polarella glacialis TaxID=89957 RepID=A0A813JTM8_POLGL|nr:unnamed protein product [Polarella glacialis]
MAKSSQIGLWAVLALTCFGFVVADAKVNQEECEMPALLNSMQPQPPLQVLLQKSSSSSKAGIAAEAIQVEHMAQKDLARDGYARMMKQLGMAEFLIGLVSNILMCAIFLGVFMYMRLKYPVVYSNNVLIGVAPRKPEETLFGWVAATLETSTDEAAQAVGLDSALAIEFQALCLRILVVICIPMLFIIAPLNCYFGSRSGADNLLARVTLDNVIDGHSWLLNLHGLAVLGICYAVRTLVFQAQGEFLERRFTWLKNLSGARATTVLVEGIPKAYRSDAKVLEFFSDIFGPEAIMQADVVKRTEALEGYLENYVAAKAGKKEAELQLETSKVRPTMRPTWFGASVDSIDYYSKELTKLDGLIPQERSRIKKEAAEVGGINTRSAFVEFRTPRDAAVSKYVNHSANKTEWVVSTPPDIHSIRWCDLRQKEDANCGSLFGKFIILCLFACFAPITVAISDAAEAIDAGILGPFEALWNAQAATIGLTIFLSMLPTVLLLIFRTFFTLRCERVAQQKLHVYYFWFLVSFVLLTPPIGLNIVELAAQVSASPWSLFYILASKFPGASCFFLNYLLLQWTVECMSAMRYTNLGKYRLFRVLYEKEEARQMAEPEDQDFYGLGARSACWTINLLLGIVFASLNPLVPAVALCYFCITRLVYGYLIVFAETKKPDLGGLFWVTQLKHVLLGTVIYCALMVGVFLKKDPTGMPSVLAFAGLLYMASAYIYFDEYFFWETLPFSEVAKCADGPQTSSESYAQPELMEPTASVK